MILGNLFCGQDRTSRSKKVTMTQQPLDQSQKWANRASETTRVDLSQSRWNTVEESTMFSPMGTRKSSRSRQNQLKMTMPRYSKNCSAAYATRQDQILQTYLQSRPVQRSRKPSPYRSRNPESRNTSQEAKLMTDFYPILQSYGCTISPTPKVNQLPHLD